MYDAMKAYAAPGAEVRPRPELLELRPELEGDAGEILWVEQDEVVVRWRKQPKPYRVAVVTIEIEEGP